MRQKKSVIPVTVTCGTIGLLHTHRLLHRLGSSQHPTCSSMALFDHRYGTSHIVRELIIAVLGLGAVYVFLRDMQAGQPYEGIIKMVVLLGIANLLLPCIWCTGPRRLHHGKSRHGGDVEEIDDVPSSPDDADN